MIIICNFLYPKKLRSPRFIFVLCFAVSNKRSCLNDSNHQRPTKSNAEKVSVGCITCHKIWPNWPDFFEDGLCKTTNQHPH